MEKALGGLSIWVLLFLILKAFIFGVGIVIAIITFIVCLILALSKC